MRQIIEHSTGYLALYGVEISGALWMVQARSKGENVHPCECQKALLLCLNRLAFIFTHI